MFTGLFAGVSVWFGKYKLMFELVLLGIGTLALALLIGGSVYYYKDTQARIKTLTESITTLSDANKQLNLTVTGLTKDAADIKTLQDQTQKSIDDIQDGVQDDLDAIQQQDYVIPAKTNSKTLTDSINKSFNARLKALEGSQ